MKKIKVFVRKFLQMVALGGVVSVVIAVSFFIGRYTKTEVSFADNTDSFASKVDVLKNEVIENIAKCESGNAPKDKALVVYDNNSRGTLKGKNIASIGVMQMKVSTIQHFWKVLHNEDISNYDATILALDNDKAKALAKEAIFGIEGGVFHWTCANKDIINQVTFIKKLK